MRTTLGHGDSVGNIRKNAEMAKERGDGTGTWDVSVLESILTLSSGLAMVS